MPKFLLYKVGFSVEQAGEFEFNLQRMPYGYRIFGAFGWKFSPSESGTPIVNLTRNGATGSRGNDTPKHVEDTTAFSGTVNMAGTFELLIPLVPYEDIEFNY